MFLLARQTMGAAHQRGHALSRKRVRVVVTRHEDMGGPWQGRRRLKPQRRHVPDLLAFAGGVRLLDRAVFFCAFVSAQRGRCGSLVLKPVRACVHGTGVRHHCSCFFLLLKGRSIVLAIQVRYQDSKNAHACVPLTFAALPRHRAPCRSRAPVCVSASFLCTFKAPTQRALGLPLSQRYFHSYFLVFFFGRLLLHSGFYYLPTVVGGTPFASGTSLTNYKNRGSTHRTTCKWFNTRSARTHHQRQQQDFNTFFHSHSQQQQQLTSVCPTQRCLRHMHFCWDSFLFQLKATNR